MRWPAFALCLLFLIACAQTELPPSPPPIGGDSSAGHAIGGIPLSNTSLPSWAGPLLYTDVTPASLIEGDTVTVTITKPDFVTTQFYVYGNMYVYNKKSAVWEKLVADVGKSGKITGPWADSKAVFSFPVGTNRFGLGNNFFVVYWCIDTDTRDANSNKIWNCNGKKWGLGAFELKAKGFAELIEKDIANNKYKNSNQTETQDGTEFLATYEGQSGVLTKVKVLKLSNFKALKTNMAQNVPYLESIWTTFAGTCGFLQTDKGSATFTWFTADSRVSVQTFSTAVDDQKVSAYAARYPANCQLVEEVKRIAIGGTGYCGNAQIESSEQCDTSNDAACPGLCKPDCTCLVKGDPGTGTCGDFLVEKPNSKGAIENCEPPEKRDVITGQMLSGSMCYMRDTFTNAVQSLGHCNDQCGCVSGTPVLSRCGNGACDSGEDTATCPSDCPVDTTAPFVTIFLPSATQANPTSPTTYTISAIDQSKVNSCTVSTDGLQSETMAQSGVVWTLTKALSEGDHTVAFICTDAKSFAKSVNRTFKALLNASPIALNLTNGTNASNAPNNSNAPAAAQCAATQGQPCNRNQCVGTGTVKCDGTCTAGLPNVPANFGNACGCGGTVKCDGGCTKELCPVGQVCQNGACALQQQAPRVVEVDIANFAFGPAVLVINKGDSVKFVNMDQAPHTASADNGAFDTGILANGQTKVIAFPNAGVISYHCNVHPTMTATITVQ